MYFTMLAYKEMNEIQNYVGKFCDITIICLFKKNGIYKRVYKEIFCYIGN